MANFNPKKIVLNQINNGQRYNDGDVVNSESVNAPIESSAYAQAVAEVAEKKSTIVVRNVTTTQVAPTEIATATANMSYAVGANNSNLDFIFKIPQGKQGRSFTSKGTWNGGITYTFSADKVDTVLHNGSQYLAKVSHLSTSGNAPPNMTYWQILASIGKGLVWKGSWTTGTTYINNDTKQDLVFYNSKAYICLATHIGSASYPPTNTSYWQLFTDSGATYTPTLSSDGIITWTNDKGLTNPPANFSIKNSLTNVNNTMSSYMQQTTQRVDELEQEIIEGQGTKVSIGGNYVRDFNADTKVDTSKLGEISGVATLDSNAKLVQRAVYDTNGNAIATYYMPKSNPTIIGALSIADNKSKIKQGTVSPNGSNLGYNGLMLTHHNNDEGGLLITEDGAYLWNSTDSGCLLKGFDEDLWVANLGAKKDCDFTNGLMFNFDSSGNLKLKGRLYQENGTKIALTSIMASQITVEPNSNFGNASTLQGVLDYIANVFAGNNTVTKIKANRFDTIL